MEQSTNLNVGLWSGHEKKKREIGMARKRAENREGSLGFPGDRNSVSYNATRNVYAAWARKLTTAKPDDPELQNIHQEVGKSGEIVSNLLAKLDIPLFKIPASEKELDRIIFRLKNKRTEPSPAKNREAKKPAAVSPPHPFKG
ncbi:hypothetical protein TNCV_809601 [Trichonephila clavipes]|uniref:Uncharacterized protein n=1 Tax=Trichonephila clavipes TaxID=2585209 RepID=A0A8X6V875_TRICX|nr:hypothetical protein TNCV_809601 [Trichonephila clavipes]